MAIVDINPETAKQVVTEIRELGRQSISVVADVTLAADAKRMVDTVVEEWGRLDIAINNAGRVIWGDTVAVPEEDWDKVMDLNTPRDLQKIQGARLTCPEGSLSSAPQQMRPPLRSCRRH